MYEKLAQYYNHITGVKNYKKECENILSYCKIHNIKQNNLLDIGCGTGQHLLYLQDHFKSLTGVDISTEMIKEASSALKSHVSMEVGTVKDINGTSFDVIISMFNVVNHLLTLDELTDFFEQCEKRLNVGGLFIFDAFNGNRVIEDPPKTERREVGELEILIEPSVDLTTSFFSMTNKIKKKNDTLLEYRLEHTLWPLKIYTDLLKINGLEIIDLDLGYKTLLIAKKK